MQLASITAAMVNQAIDIYLGHAYDDEALRESHRVKFAPGLSMREVLESFDRDPETRLASHTLRLGCQHYPHMKLALWEAYFRGEYVFAVDRHDGFDFGQETKDYDAWLGLRSKNFRIKAMIESDWYEAGIPTIRRLKEERLSQSDVLREFVGHSVLLVDNDADAGAVQQMILASEGYHSIWAGSLEEVKEILDDPERGGRCGMALVDVLLSDGSGVDVLKLIRACPRTRDIPVVLTSAMSSSDVMLADADSYLRKPYRAEDLLKVIADTLRRRYDGHQQLVAEFNGGARDDDAAAENERQLP